MHGLVPDLFTISQRLAAQTWAWHDDQTGQVLTWLQHIGCRVLSRPEYGQTWMLQGIAGTNACLSLGHDPIATAQTLGVLCGGMFWPQAFPHLLPLVNAAWRRRIPKRGRNV